MINGSSKPVADRLRERVLRAVAELRYVPNAHAQLLARPQRSVVGVVVHDVSDPYFAELTRGLQRVATDHGRLVIICNSYRDPERELEYVEMLRAQQVAAIVLAGSGYHDATFTDRLAEKLAAYQATGGRVAVVGRHEHPGDAVMPANTDGGRLLGAELLRQGHTRIGVVAGPRVLTTITDRLDGLRAALADGGHPLPEERIRYADFDRDGGARAAGELLDAVPGLTALVALNDSMAVGALTLLRARDVPGPRTGVRGGLRRHAGRRRRHPGADHRPAAAGGAGRAGDDPGPRPGRRPVPGGGAAGHPGRPGQPRPGPGLIRTGATAQRSIRPPAQAGVAASSASRSICRGSDNAEPTATTRTPAARKSAALPASIPRSPRTAAPAAGRRPP